MQPSLSIIVPCYNGADTIEETIASIYKQHFTIPFEIILVNDASTDDSMVILERLAQSHSGITVVSHTKNKGGGAARNTGIRSSTGTLIYCLDSDNFFAPDSFQPMIDFLQSSGVDGVAFHERRFFRENNSTRYVSQYNMVLERDIAIIDLCNETNTLLDNFLFTRASYDRTDGYPEHHGFDTQAFEVRFLAVGNTVRVCPDSIFYHRQGRGEKSYFERVYASGRFSLNYALIFEDIFYLLSPSVRTTILEFPLFTKTKLGEENLLGAVQELVRSGTPLLTDDSATYIHPDGRTAWAHDHQDSSNPTDSISLAILHIRDGSYTPALTALTTYIQQTKAITPYLSLLGLRILSGISGVPYTENITAALDQIDSLGFERPGSLSGISARLAHRYPRLYAFLLRLRNMIKRK